MAPLAAPGTPEHAAALTIALVSIAASSALYTVIWHRPRAFRALIGKRDACETMANLAHILKVVQFASIAALVDVPAAVATQPAWAWALAAALAAFGQHLNGMVYARLGAVGVYYGVRFGRSVPWVTGYPYSTFNDPQYVGCIATLLGASVFTPIEVVAWWIANYFYLMWLESGMPAAD